MALKVGVSIKSSSYLYISTVYVRGDRDMNNFVDYVVKLGFPSWLRTVSFKYVVIDIELATMLLWFISKKILSKDIRELILMDI